jgi:hypothetical protein
MAHNLRTTTVKGEKYVSATDLFKLLMEVMTLDSLHPAAIQALDGLGTGLAITLDMVDLKDLPEYLQKLKAEVDRDGFWESEEQAEGSPI